MVEYGKYRAGSELATGAFTSVYAAHKPGSSHAYAVKVLKPSPELWSEKESERQISAFLSRAEVQQKAGRVGKRYWAPVFDLGRQGAGAYYVTNQYPLSVETLIDRRMVLRSGQLYLLTLRILRGLQALDKACGQAHGNLHPNNVLLDRKSGGSYAIHLADPAVGVGIGGRSSDLQALGALIQGLITHKPVDPNRDWTLNGLETFACLGSKAAAWREFCGKLLGVGTQLAFTDLPEVAEAMRYLRPRSKWVTYVGIPAIVLLGSAAVASIMYPGHMRRWRNQLLRRNVTTIVAATQGTSTTQTATTSQVIGSATTKVVVIGPTTGPDLSEETRKAEAQRKAEENRLAELKAAELKAAELKLAEQQKLEEAARQQKLREMEAARKTDAERIAAESGFKLWVASIATPPLKSELLRLAWTSCRDRWLTKKDDELRQQVERLGAALVDWENDLPDPRTVTDLPESLQATASQRREEILRQVAAALVDAPVGLPKALSPAARLAARGKFEAWIKERSEAAQLVASAVAVLKADPADPDKEHDVLASIQIWDGNASRDAPERAELMRLRNQVKALPEKRAEKIALMVKSARDHDNVADGHQALAILTNVLKLDPDNTDAARLKLKISSYYDLPTSVEDCLMAAKAGSVPAIRDMVDRYLKGRGVAKDPAAALALLTPIAEGGDPAAMKTLGDLYASGQGLPAPDPTKALKWYDKAAATGDASAMLGVGRMHAQASPPDYLNAIEWFQKAADKGSPDAMIELATAYAEGRGTKRDPKLASQWYQKAADAGNVDAMFKLGKLAFERRDPKAMKLLNAAAEANNAEAMHYMGSLYNVGLNVDQDYSKALAWYQKAADAGSVGAMFDLAEMYNGGSGVKQNVASAVPWYQKAAKAGDVKSMFKLGVIYQRGAPGVPADPAQSLNWFRSAANAGNSMAMRKMATFYQEGTGVDKDAAIAADWRHKAEDAAAKGQ